MKERCSFCSCFHILKSRKLQDWLWKWTMHELLSKVIIQIYCKKVQVEDDIYYLNRQTVYPKPNLVDQQQNANWKFLVHDKQKYFQIFNYFLVYFREKYFCSHGTTLPETCRPCRGEITKPQSWGGDQEGEEAKEKSQEAGQRECCNQDQGATRARERGVCVSTKAWRRID